MTLAHLSLRVLWLLACVGRGAAVRYGDYSVGHIPHMPQYNDDVAPAHDHYGDRSPDAPARLDYKYQEEPHGRSDDSPVKDVIDERIWDKPIKKKRKPPNIRSGPHRDIDKYSLDETEPELKSDKRFVSQGSQFRNRDFAILSDSQRHLKHDAIDQSDDIDSVDSNSDYISVHKQDGEGAGADVELRHVRYRSSTARKPRRKPRDRALHPPEWRESRNDAKLEQGEVDLEIKNPRRYGGSVHEQEMKRKHKDNYDYDEYYDMKRVQHMRSRLPALLRHSTVRTTEAKSASPSGHWVIRRDTPTPTPAAATAATTAPQSSTLSTTTRAASVSRPAELSLAEKSRLSILKKAQRKENPRNVSASTKPPVLMQVTRKMQTMVMVEPPPETAMRARGVLEDSPERLQRARQLMRHKLVAGARSIHELTDDWDQMVCDYIDVSLLDTDAASNLHTGYDEFDGGQRGGARAAGATGAPPAQGGRRRAPGAAGPCRPRWPRRPRVLYHGAAPHLPAAGRRPSTRYSMEPFPNIEPTVPHD